MTDQPSTTVAATRAMPPSARSPWAAVGPRLSGPWGLAAVAACGCAATAVMDPTEHRMSVGCPFQVVTGWWCPFCGATRSVSRLVRADLGGALHYNALLVAVLPVVAMVWAAHALPSDRGWRRALRSHSSVLMVCGAVLAVAFTVLRNLPLEPFTSMRFPGA